MAWFYFRNWVMAPMLWVASMMCLAAVLGIEVNWRLWVLLAASNVVVDFVDLWFEGRPVEGPRRWK